MARQFGLLSVAAGALIAGAGAASAADVTPAEAARLLARPGVIALDVRTPQEFAAGRLAGAVNIDYRAADFASAVARLDPDAQYVLYCRSGRRSAGALAVLRKAGINKVDHLATGILGWRAAGLPVVDD